MYKRRVNIIIVTVLTLLFVFTNPNYAQHFNGGVMAGLTASQVDGDTYSGYNKAGFMAGAFLSLPLKPRYDLQFELRYIQKGSSFKQDNSVFKLKLNYVEMPITLQYAFKPKITFDAGLAIAYLGQYSQEDENGTLEAPEGYRKIEVNGLLGASYKVTSRLKVNVNFSYSITPIWHRPTNYTIDRFNWQFNNLFEIGVYYQLNQIVEGIDK
jgi:hypothetical protein